MGDQMLTRTGLCFLDLPKNVRERVYAFAGMSGNTLSLNYTNLRIYLDGAYPSTEGSFRLKCHHIDAPIYRINNIGKEVFHELGGQESMSDFYEDICGDGGSKWSPYFCEHPAGPCDASPCPTRAYGLLTVSKEVSDEVITFVFKTNEIRVSQGAPHGLSRIINSGSKQFAALTRLTILLGVTLQGSIHLEDQYDWCENGLDSSTRSGRWLLKEWRDTVTKLKNHANLSQLALDVSIYGRSPAVIVDCLQTLEDLTGLKDCAIQAYLQPRPAQKTPESPPFLRSHVQRAVRKVVSCPPVVSEKNTSIRYNRGSAARGLLDLSEEVIAMIMEYTDLVSPREVLWRPPKNQPTRRGHSNDCISQRFPFNGPEPCDCFSDELLYETRFDPSCCMYCSFAYDDSCFCPYYGAASSSTCKCLITRHALFFVNRLIRRLAIGVYYSRNRIFVAPYGSSPRKAQIKRQPVCREMPLETELSLYISTIPREAFRSIRWLEWVTPKFVADLPDEGYLSEKTPAWFAYLQTLELMKSWNLNALTFAVNFVTLSDSAQAFNHFRKIVSPIRSLYNEKQNRLKNFFVYIRDTPAGFDPREWERQLERVVMGPSYDGYEAGKPPERYTSLYDEIYVAQNEAPREDFWQWIPTRNPYPGKAIPKERSAFLQNLHTNSSEPLID